MRSISKVIDLVYPKRCPICEDIVLPKGASICKKCYETLPWVAAPYCMKCGKPIDQPTKEYCYDCEKKQFHYEYGYGMWVYDEKLRKSIVGFKYKNRKEYADFYVEELVKRYSKKIEYMQVDVIVPVPIHKRKLRSRGYNQAAILADKLGERLQIKVEEDLLIRTRYTAPQKTLDDKQRIRNLQQAFQMNPDTKYKYQGKSILLIDDIYTTGSTIEVCTNVLLKAGVSHVYYISLCIGKGY